MVNDDVKAGTIFGVLARPVSRGNYFLGSWLAAGVILGVIEAMRCSLAVAAALLYDGRVSWASLVAMAAALAGDLLLLAMFAALGGAWTTGVAVFAGVCCILVQSLAFSAEVPMWIAYPARAIASLLPLSLYQNDAIVRVLTGAARDATPLFEIIAYRVCWTIALVLLGTWAFQRREMAPRI